MNTVFHLHVKSKNKTKQKQTYKYKKQTDGQQRADGVGFGEIAEGN